MAFFPTAFETLPLAGSQGTLEKLAFALSKADKMGYVQSAPNSTMIKLIPRNDILDTMVPAFKHPVVVGTGPSRQIFVDVRMFGRIDLASNQYKITNPEGYDATLLRARLQEQWINGNPKQLKNLELSTVLYPSWISESLSRTLMLNPGDQAVVYVLSYIFYNSLFATSVPTQQQKDAIAYQIVKNSRLPGDIVKELVDTYPYIESITQLCDNIKERLNNVRTNSLSPATLYAVLGGTWYGDNSAELIAVALEHVPTWIYVVYNACASRSYHHARLTKMIAERSALKTKTPAFLLALTGL